MAPGCVLLLLLLVVGEGRPIVVGLAVGSRLGRPPYRPQGLALIALNLCWVGPAAALEVQVLADRVVK